MIKRKPPDKENPRNWYEQLWGIPAGGSIIDKIV
jgi:hypothetical protein